MPYGVEVKIFLTSFVVDEIQHAGHLTAVVLGDVSVKFRFSFPFAAASLTAAPAAPSATFAGSATFAAGHLNFVVGNRSLPALG